MLSSSSYLSCVVIDSHHFTRSKALRPSVSQDVPSDVEPVDITPDTETSGFVRLQVTAAREPESVPQQLAEPPSAPAPVEGESGETGSGSSPRGVPPSAPGGRVDPVEGQTCFMPISEFTPHQYQPNLALSDSGIPGPPPDATAVGKRPTSSATRHPSTPRPRPTPQNLTHMVTVT